MYIFLIHISFFVVWYLIFELLSILLLSTEIGVVRIYLFLIC